MQLSAVIIFLALPGMPSWRRAAKARVPMRDQIVGVECYSGYQADERPARLELKDGVKEIMTIEDRWYSPGATYFRVVADDGDPIHPAPRRSPGCLEPYRVSDRSDRSVIDTKITSSV